MPREPEGPGTLKIDGLAKKQWLGQGAQLRACWTPTECTLSAHLAHSRCFQAAFAASDRAPQGTETSHTHTHSPACHYWYPPKLRSAQENRHPLLIPAHRGFGLCPTVGQGVLHSLVANVEALQAQSGLELVLSPRTEESLWGICYAKKQSGCSCSHLWVYFKSVALKKKKICFCTFQINFFLHFFFQKECNFI